MYIDAMMHVLVFMDLLFHKRTCAMFYELSVEEK